MILPGIRLIRKSNVAGNPVYYTFTRYAILILEQNNLEEETSSLFPLKHLLFVSSCEFLVSSFKRPAKYFATLYGHFVEPVIPAALSSSPAGY